MSEENKTMVRRFIEEFWNKSDMEVVEQLVSTNVVRHHIRNQDQDLHGIEEFKKWVAENRKAFPDMRFTIENIFAEGDQVMAHMRGEATHKGAFGGVEPSGTEVTFTSTAMMRLTDGKITECWLIADSLGILQQLGVIRPIG